MQTARNLSAAIQRSEFIALVVVKKDRVVWANSAVHVMFGRDPGTLIGQPVRTMFVDPTSCDAFSAAVSAVIESNTTFHGEIPQQRNDGATGWYEFSISCLAGQPDTAIAAIVDQTSRRQSQARIRFQSEILASIRDGVNIVSMDGTIRYTNAAFDAMLGYAPGELVGQNIAIVNAETDRSPQEVAQDIIDDLSRSGEWLGEVLTRRKDGTHLWSSLNVSTHESDEWGTVWVSVLRDITLQREIQASLRASEQRYRRLVDTFSVVTWHCPPDGLHITPQPTWMAFTGQTAEEMLGAGWTKVVHPDDATAAALQWQSAVERGEPFENVHRIRRHDGSWRWMSVRAVPIRDNEGSIVEWMGMGQDITEQILAETALAESEERLENALAGSGLALWDWDISRHEVTGDHRWQDILGYPIGELGKAEETWMQLIHPDDLGRFNANLAAHLQGETDRFQNEHRLRHKLGHWVAVEAAGRVTRRDQDAQPTRMSGTVLDISQKRRLNEEGVQLLKRIEALIHETTSGPPQRDSQADLVASLTRRQREILCLIAAGKTSAEIGRQLNLSTNTVVSHRRNLMAKLDLHTTADVTRFALANRMLDRG